MFDILYNAHLASGHGGKYRMESECKIKYNNITQDVIKLYLRLCEGFQKKLKSFQKGLVVKPMIFSKMNSRGQVDLILICNPIQMENTNLSWCIRTT